MEKTMLIEAKTVGGLAPVKVLDFHTEGDNLSFFYKHIECDCVDIVRAYALSDNPLLEDVCLVVDDEGLFRGEPIYNVIGSLLYGYLDHGQAIAGNVLVCKDVYTEKGIETGELTDEEVTALQLAINELVSKFNERVVERNAQTSE